MIALLLQLVAALLLQLHGPAPVPHGVTVAPVIPAPAVRVAPAAPGVPQYSRGPRPEGPAAPTVAAPAPAPAPLSVFGPAPLCVDGQDPARDDCVQGQLPEETLGRAYG